MMQLSSNVHHANILVKHVGMLDPAYHVMQTIKDNIKENQVYVSVRHITMIIRKMSRNVRDVS